MTDRELLEMAAKAAQNGAEWYAAIGMGIDNGTNIPTLWNPLTDDGDALRLAVKLRFGIKDFAPHDEPNIVQIPPDGALFGMVEIWRESDDDPLYVEWYKAGADRYAATRRAIVRAAAEIGGTL